MASSSSFGLLRAVSVAILLLLSISLFPSGFAYKVVHTVGETTIATPEVTLTIPLKTPLNLCKPESAIVITSCLDLIAGNEITGVSGTVMLATNFEVDLVLKKNKQKICFTLDSCKIWDQAKLKNFATCDTDTASFILKLKMAGTTNSTTDKLSGTVLISGNSGEVSGDTFFITKDTSGAGAVLKINDKTTCQVEVDPALATGQTLTKYFVTLDKSSKIPKCSNAVAASPPTAIVAILEYTTLENITLTTDDKSDNQTGKFEFNCAGSAPPPLPPPPASEGVKGWAEGDVTATSSASISAKLTLPPGKTWDACEATTPVVISGCFGAPREPSSLRRSLAGEPGKTVTAIKIIIDQKLSVDADFKLQTSGTETDKFCFVVDSCKIYRTISELNQYTCAAVADLTVDVKFDAALTEGHLVSYKLLISGFSAELGSDLKGSIKVDSSSAALLTKTEVGDECTVTAKADYKIESYKLWVSKGAVAPICYPVKDSSFNSDDIYTGDLFLQKPHSMEAFKFLSTDPTLNEKGSPIDVACKKGGTPDPPPPSEKLKKWLSGKVGVVGKKAVTDVTFGKTDVTLCSIDDAMAISGCFHTETNSVPKSASIEMDSKTKVPVVLKKSVVDGKDHYCFVSEACAFWSSIKEPTTYECPKITKATVTVEFDADLTSQVDYQILVSGYMVKLGNSTKKEVFVDSDSVSTASVTEVGKTVNCSADKKEGKTIVANRVWRKANDKALSCQDPEATISDKDIYLGYLFAQSPSDMATMKFIETDMKDLEKGTPIKITCSDEETTTSTTTTSNGASAGVVLASVATAATFMVMLVQSN